VTPVETLLRDGPAVINIGVRDFADSVADQSAQVVHVDWRPPPELEPELAELLEVLG
jgi:hypothetical protein